MFKAPRPHGSVRSVDDLKTAGRWFEGSGSANIFSEAFMTVLATGFIPLSTLFLVSTMVRWESSQWLGKNIVRSTG